MKKRVTERVLVLILSIAVLLSSTGAYSAFASNENTSLSATSSTEKSTSAAPSTTSANETTTSADNGNSQQPNIVEQGGAVESGVLAGQGTAQNPYKIASADDFIKMQDIINDSSKSDKHFVLTADINLSGVKMAQLTANKAFTGSLVSVNKNLSDATPKSVWFDLDGKNHKIYGFKVNNTDAYCAAIFGYISSNSTIRNVVFENCSVNVTSEYAVTNSVAVLYNDGKITSCSFSGITLTVGESAACPYESKGIFKVLRTKNSTAVVAGYNNGEISSIKVSDINVNVASARYQVGVVVGLNDGKVSGVSVSSSALTTSQKNVSSSIGIISGLNSSEISECTVLNSTVKNGTNAAFIAGTNAGSIYNCLVSGSVKNTQPADEANAQIVGAGVFGGIAGTSTGKISFCTVSDLGAVLTDDAAVFGSIVGTTNSSVDDSTASGSVSGKGKAGGIVGQTYKTGDNDTASVKRCYTFTSLNTENNDLGAVIASGSAEVFANAWSSEISGRFMAYDTGAADGDTVQSTRLIVLKAGESRTISKASLGGSWGEVSRAVDSTKSFTLTGTGIKLTQNENDFTLTASAADKIGTVSYTARLAISAGYKNSTVTSQSMTITVLTLPEEAEGDGLTAETPIQITNSAEFAMLGAAPYAHFTLKNDVEVPENWAPVALSGSLNGEGKTLNVSTPLFSGVYGEISNVQIKLCGEIKTAMLGKASGAKLDGVRLVCGEAKEESEVPVRLLAEKSGTAAFLNKVSGSTVIANSYSEIPVHIADKEVSNVAGFIAVLDANAATITSSGASAVITADFEGNIPDSAAFIGKVVSNKDGSVSSCFATLESKVVSYALIGGGNSDEFKAENCYYSETGAKAAPDSFKNVVASVWSFDAGKQGFISGKGSVVAITLPKDVAAFASVGADDFYAEFDSDKLSVNTAGITVKDGVLYLPAEAAQSAVTVLNSKVTLTHKPTGLKAQISLSNGLEQDADGNYLIYYAVDLAFINENLSKFNGASFKLANDIDMSSATQFEPIGGAGEAFTGTFDGCSHKIVSLTLDGTSKAGLFGTLKNAQVKNIVFESAKISASGSYAAVLAGQIKGKSSVSNITFNNCSVVSADSYAGLLAGSIGADASVSNITVNSADVQAMSYAGAVVGSAQGIKADNVSISASSVTASGYAGVFAGYLGESSALNGVTLKSCSVDGGKFAGGVAGCAENTVIDSVKADSLKVTAQSGAVAPVGYAGGIAGGFSGEIKNSTVNNSSVTAVISGGLVGSAVKDQKTAVQFCSVDAVKVTSAGSASVSGGIVALVQGEAVVSGANVGKNTAVSGGYINGGIIGEVKNSAEISACTSYAEISGFTASAKASVGTGGAVGRVGSDAISLKIEKVNVCGSVKAFEAVGGIIGSIDDSAECSLNVTSSVSACTIGVNSNNKNSAGYVIGSVGSFNSEKLASAVKSVVFSSYSSQLSAFGSVDSNVSCIDLDKEVVTSLNGELSTTDEITVSVKNNKASAFGFVFDSENGWKSESQNKVSVKASNENSVTLQPKESADVAVVAVYRLKDNKDVSLKVHFDVKADIKAKLAGSGTETDPFRVSNAAELDAVSYYNGEGVYFVLTNDIIFTAEDFTFGGDYYNGGLGFEPIGTDSAPFVSEFDGNSHKIVGLNMSGDMGGLFGVIDSAKISNLTISDATVASKSVAGVLAAKATGSVIDNVKIVSSTVSADNAEGTAGAVVGYALSSRITSVEVNSIAVSAGAPQSQYPLASASAIAARAENTVVSNAQVGSDVKVESNGAAGGIFARVSSATVKDSASYADVSGTAAGSVAGVVNGGLVIKNAYAGGTVSGTASAAGIAASANDIIKAQDITVSASIKSQEGLKGVIIADADISVYTDSSDCEASFENIIYSSYPDNISLFGTKELNSYQSNGYVSAVTDINALSCEDGDFAAVGAEGFNVADSVKLGFESQGNAVEFKVGSFGFKLQNVTSEPEGLVKYNAETKSVTAAETSLKDAKLVLTYSGGIRAAVDMISVKGMLGDGSNASPYQINSEDTLKLLTIYPNANFVMTSDVNLENDWTPAAKFTGKLDGAGCTISNLKVNGGGLFELLDGNAVVKNVTFDNAIVGGSANAGVVAASVAGNAKISGVNIISCEVNSSDYAGGVAGIVNSSACEISSAEVKSSKINAANAAGIAALVSGEAQISACKADSSVINGTYAAGGIIAVADAQKLMISGCASSSDVKAKNAGAIVGTAEAALEIYSCTAEGTVSGVYAEGGIIGFVNTELDGDLKISNCTVSSELSGAAKYSAGIVARFVPLPEDNDKFAKMFTGNKVSGDYNSFETAVMKYQNLPAEDVKTQKPELEGNGTAESPYIISSAADISAIPDGTDAYYKLTADINIAPEDYGISVDENGKTVYGSFYGGYSPIKDFGGVFDGGDHIISGLYIDSDSDYVGLFASVVGVGTVKNLRIEILSESEGFGFSGISGKDYVGGIAGYCESANGIVNCSVTGGEVNGERNVGALVGALASSKVEGSFAVSAVKGTKAVGGLVGLSSGKSSVVNSFSSGAVYCEGGSLVGRNTGSLNIKDVFVSGSSLGGDSVVIGSNSGSVTAENMLIAGTNATGARTAMPSGDYKNVYADVSVLGTDDRHINKLTTNTLTSALPEGLDSWTANGGSYPTPSIGGEYAAEWAKLAAATVSVNAKEPDVKGGFAYPVTVGVDGAVIKSSALSGADDLIISGTKVSNDYFGDSAPFITVETASGASRVIIIPQRNDENTLYVSSLNQLEALNGKLTDEKYAPLKAYLNNENTKIILTDDINFGASALNAENDFEPIDSFKGSFNGNGYKLKNIRINKTTGDAGLFTSIGGNETVVEFKNIVLDNVFVTGSSNAGALAGKAGKNTVITNCTVTGSDSYVSAGVAGGLVGESSADITSCTSFASVSGAIGDSASVGIGGLVGVMNGGSIKNSSAAADIVVTAVANSSDNDSLYGIGGLVGLIGSSCSAPAVSTSFSTGTVSVTNALAADGNSAVGIGGLVGVAQGDVESVYSSSSVTADFTGRASGNAVRAIGGLIGISYANASDAYASGGVSATLGGVKIYGKDCLCGGVIGAGYGEIYKNLYFDKQTDNDRNLKAVSNVSEASCCGVSTADLASATSDKIKLSSKFGLADSAYPYIRAFANEGASDYAIYSTLLSVVTTAFDENDASAKEGNGITKPITLPSSLSLEGKTYSLVWLAGANAEIESGTASAQRSKDYADYLSLTLSCGGFSRTYSRLCADTGSFEASVGNVKLEYSLVNKTGDKKMDSALVGVLIKSVSPDKVITSDFFTDCSAQSKKLNNILVTAGGFYIDSNLPSGYEFELTAKDSAGNTVDITDCGENGSYVEIGSGNYVSVTISIVKTDIPWGLTSLWESLVR